MCRAPFLGVLSLPLSSLPPLSLPLSSFPFSLPLFHPLLRVLSGLLSITQHLNPKLLQEIREEIVMSGCYGGLSRK